MGDVPFYLKFLVVVITILIIHYLVLFKEKKNTYMRTDRQTDRQITDGKQEAKIITVIYCNTRSLVGRLH